MRSHVFEELKKGERFVQSSVYDLTLYFLMDLA
jgi:hypothetical protein